MKRKKVKTPKGELRFVCCVCGPVLAASSELKCDLGHDVIIKRMYVDKHGCQNWVSLDADQ